jgi:hypothetical protein
MLVKALVDKDLGQGIDINTRNAAGFGKASRDNSAWHTIILIDMCNYISLTF